MWEDTLIYYIQGTVTTVDPRKLAHCKLCRDAMFYIYDQKLRDYCWPCLEELAMENARRILGTK